MGMNGIGAAIMVINSHTAVTRCLQFRIRKTRRIEYITERPDLRWTMTLSVRFAPHVGHFSKEIRF